MAPKGGIYLQDFRVVAFDCRSTQVYILNRTEGTLILGFKFRTQEFQ